MLLAQLEQWFDLVREKNLGEAELVEVMTTPSQNSAVILQDVMVGGFSVWYMHL